MDPQALYIAECAAAAVRPDPAVRAALSKGRRGTALRLTGPAAGSDDRRPWTAVDLRCVAAVADAAHNPRLEVADIAAAAVAPVVGAWLGRGGLEGREPPLLVLARCDVTAGDADRLAEALACCRARPSDPHGRPPPLRFEVTDSAPGSVAGLLQAAVLMARGGELVSLRLCRCGLGQADAPFLAASLGQATPHVAGLSLEGNAGLGGVSSLWRDWVPRVVRHSGLRFLDLSHCSLEDDAAAALCDVLPRMAGLTAFNARGNRFTAAALELFAEAVAECPSLLEVALGAHVCGPETTLSLLLALGGNATLTNVDLEQLSTDSADCVAALLDLVETAPTLRVLVATPPESAVSPVRTARLGPSARRFRPALLFSQQVAAINERRQAEGRGRLNVCTTFDDAQAMQRQAEGHRSRHPEVAVTPSRPRGFTAQPPVPALEPPVLQSLVAPMTPATSHGSPVPAVLLGPSTGTTPAATPARPALHSPGPSSQLSIDPGVMAGPSSHRAPAKLQCPPLPLDDDAPLEANSAIAEPPERPSARPRERSPLRRALSSLASSLSSCGPSTPPPVQQRQRSPLRAAPTATASAPGRRSPPQPTLRAVVAQRSPLRERDTPVDAAELRRLRAALEKSESQRHQCCADLGAARAEAERVGRTAQTLGREADRLRAALSTAQTETKAQAERAAEVEARLADLAPRDMGPLGDSRDPSPGPISATPPQPTPRGAVGSPIGRPTRWDTRRDPNAPVSSWRAASPPQGDGRSGHRGFGCRDPRRGVATSATAAAEVPAHLHGLLEVPLARLLLMYPDFEWAVAALSAAERLAFDRAWDDATAHGVVASDGRTLFVRSARAVRLVAMLRQCWDHGLFKRLATGCTAPRWHPGSAVS